MYDGSHAHRLDKNSTKISVNSPIKQTRIVKHILESIGYKRDTKITDESGHIVGSFLL